MEAIAIRLEAIASRNKKLLVAKEYSPSDAEPLAMRVFSQ